MLILNLVLIRCARLLNRQIRGFMQCGQEAPLYILAAASFAFVVVHCGM